MNSAYEPATAPMFVWSEDLLASRDLSRSQIEHYGFLLGWFDEWRRRMEQAPGRDAAELFWKRVVKSKDRQEWQLDQWGAALAWYLNWLRYCVRDGGGGRSLPERLRAAVHATGCRRGLAMATRKTYAGWIARYGAWAESPRRAMEEEAARTWLGLLVEEGRVSFATQKQALNALVFC